MLCPCCEGYVYITNADMIMICSVVDSIDNNVTIEISDDDNR